MFTYLRTYSKLARIICFLFAVHIFNLSVDPKDREPDFMPEDLSFNEIETIAEFLAEVVLGIDNAFEERDEPDGTDVTHDFHKAFYFHNGTAEMQSGHPFRLLETRHFGASNDRFTTRAREITSPPPKG